MLRPAQGKVQTVKAQFGCVIIAILASTVLPTQAVAQDSKGECEQRMTRCWIANNGAGKPKSINDQCNTRSVCGWQTGIGYDAFICAPGQHVKCEMAKRRLH